MDLIKTGLTRTITTKAVITIKTTNKISMVVVGEVGGEEGTTTEVVGGAALMQVIRAPTMPTHETSIQEKENRVRMGLRLQVRNKRAMCRLAAVCKLSP